MAPCIHLGFLPAHPPPYHDVILNNRNHDIVIIHDRDSINDHNHDIVTIIDRNHDDHDSIS